MRIVGCALLVACVEAPHNSGHPRWAASTSTGTFVTATGGSGPTTEPSTWSTPTDSWPSSLTETTDTTSPTTDRPEWEGTLDLELFANPGSTLSAVAVVTVDPPIPVQLELWSDGVAPLRTAVSEGGIERALPLVGMRADSTYHVRLIGLGAAGREVAGPSRTFLTGPLPEPIRLLFAHDSPAEFTFWSDPDRTSGITLFSPWSVEHADELGLEHTIGLDSEGQVVWYHQRDIHLQGPGELLASADLAAVSDALVVRTYDQLGVPLREVPMLSHAHHDVAMLPSGNPIVLRGFTIDAHVPELGGDVRAKSDRVAEVDPLTGETVWEWLAHDDLDTTYYPGPLSMDSVDGVYEWLHANSVVHHQPNDTVLVSFRNVSWVVLVDHATGEHLWTLGANGDFELESGEWFNGQHAASLIDDHTVILFDNGNEKGPGTTSRAVAYTVDTEAWTAREVWSWDTGVFARNYGDADRLSNGHTLVNAAGSRSGPGRVAEVSLDGEVVWDLGFHESFNNYRVTRVPWVLPAP